MPNLQSVQSVAMSLVERAREGDENAMGMIMVVREQAKKGNAKAQTAIKELHDYATAHPVAEADADIGAEAELHLSVLKDVGPIVGLPILLKLPEHGSDALFAASVILANGKSAIGQARLNAIAEGLKTPEERELFFYAVENSHKGIREDALAMATPDKRVFYAGLCIGLAQNIQRVRTPEGLVSRFSPSAGWELGEVTS